MPRINQKFDLRLKFQRMFEVGLILAISLIILAFRFFPQIKAEVIESPIPQDLFEVEDIISISDIAKPPVPTKPVFDIVEELDDDEVEDIPIEGTDWDDFKPAENPPEIEGIEEDLIVDFYAVEDMPELIGGLSALQKNVAYPEIAVKAGIQGKVILKALIGKNGEVETTQILKSLGAGCDESAIAAVMKAKFKPGMQRGRTVRVYISIPISFVLKN